MSVVHIIYPETMDEQKQKPREQGLNDPKLGTIDRMYSCATCKEDIQVCPGHFGHIELHTPVFHVGFVVKIKKLLETICHTCGMIKADFVSLPTRRQRLQALGRFLLTATPEPPRLACGRQDQGREEAFRQDLAHVADQECVRSGC